MKKTIYKIPEEIKFKSGHENFDKQIKYIGIGEVITNTQISTYIKPKRKIEDKETIFPKEFLKILKLKKINLPTNVIQEIKKITDKGKTIILYCFFHYANKTTVHGYIITTENGELIKKFVTGRTGKSWAVIEEVIKYITK